MSERGTFKESLDVLKETPELLKDFKSPLEEINIYLQQENGEISTTPHVLSIKTNNKGNVIFDIFPSFTIQDLLRALWLDLGTPNEWLPEFVFLGKPNEDSSQYESVTGNWYYPYSESLHDSLVLPNPLTHIQNGSPLPEFVSEDGERQPMNFKPKERMTLETVFLKNEKTLPILHAYNLTYLMRQYNGSRPLSAKAWYGLFNPFFPSITESGPFEATSEIIERSQITKEYIKLKIDEYIFAQDLLESLPLASINITAIRHLQMSYKKPANFDGCDTLFYTVSCNKNIPYLRYIPATGLTMTKLFRENSLKLPHINDCELLKTWNDHTLPSNISEMVIGKILISTPDAAPDMYGTLRVFQDGEADLTLQPPKNVRSIKFPKYIKSQTLSDLIEVGFYDTPYDINNGNFVQASLNFSISKDDKGTLFPKGTKRSVTKDRKYTTEITKQIIVDRLKYFKTFFQVIEFNEEDVGASIMLRYKGIDNFDSEDRIEAYLTFQTNKRLLEGEGIHEGLVKEVSNEFGLPLDEARRRVAHWIAKKTDNTVGEDTINALYNPGTDIAIYLQHPDYTFHVYRVDSLENFQKISALLNILFSATDDYFEKGKKESTAVEIEESAHVREIGENVTFKEESNSAGSAGQGSVDYFNLEGEIDETEQIELASAKPKVEKPIAPLLPSQEVGKKSAALSEEVEDKPEFKKIIPAGFYITKLKQLDSKLFDFKIQSKSDSLYTSQCQANYTRQPLSMTESEYKRMKNIYEDDLLPNEETKKQKMIFIEYGSEELEEQLKQSKNVEDSRNRFTVIKYGSSQEIKNYYLCAKYFCLQDYIIILPEEYLKAGNFRGVDKKEKECPFCTGKIIPKENMKKPLKGQTVLERTVIPKSDNKIPEYIRFLKEGSHPEGLDIPCCFIKEPSKKELTKLASLSSKKQAKRTIKPVEGDVVVAAESIDEEEEDEDDVEKDFRIKSVIEFDALKYKMSQAYILDFVKFPLPPGKIGVCSPALDEYFAQDSELLIERLQQRQQLKPSTEGFFRIGVENSTIDVNTSLFSALAPVLNQRSWKEVGEFIKNNIKPRTFINLNFGNLLLEFYDKAVNEPLKGDRVPSDGELASWSSSFLRADIEENKTELNRFYRSYNRFIKYLQNPGELKQLRHVIHALLEPGVLTTNGLTLIVVEYKGNPKTAEVEVDIKCPSLGFDINRYSRNDVAFITKDDKGFWEPLAYVHRTKILPTQKYNQEAYYKFQWKELSTIAPQIVRDRVLEFMKQCSSSYRGIYTSQPHIDSRLLLPISVVLKSLGNFQPLSIIRDAYNHLVAITLPTTTDKTKIRQSKEVVVPVADDGYVAHKDLDLRIYVSWKSVENNLAAAEDVHIIYNTVIKNRLLPLSKQYSFIDFLKGSEGIEAFRLGIISKENLDSNESYPPLVLPCADKNVELPQNIPIQEQETVEFAFNRENAYILQSETEEEYYKDSELVLKREEAEELYQTFRLTFANWLTTRKDKASFRSELKRIIDPRNRLPVYEQRRRLEILIGPILKGWLLPDPEEFEIIPMLRRVNCLQFSTEETCSGSCKWTTEDSKCRLHVPAKVPFGSLGEDKTHGDTSRVFILRLIDELVRLPSMRNELITNKVQKVQIPKKAMQIDNQYILPENVPEYDELFQLICQKKLKKTEEPRYYEEFSISPDEGSFSKVYETLGRLEPLPQEFATYFDKDAVKRLRLLIVDEPTAVDKTQKLAESLEKIDMLTFDKQRQKSFFTDNNLRSISIAVRLPVLQYLFNPPTESQKIMTATYTNYAFKEGIITFLPDNPTGPALVVLADQRKPQIPIDFFKGSLKDMLENTKVKRAFPTRVVMPVASPSASSDESSSDQSVEQ